MFKGLERKAAEIFRNTFSNNLRSRKESDIPSIGTAEWDGKSKYFTVEMTDSFYREVMRK